MLAILALTLIFSLVQQPVAQQPVIQQPLVQSPLAERPAGAKHLAIAATASAETALPGSTVSLFLDITPRPGIHVYAPGAKGYLPIAVTFGQGAGIKMGDLKYPKSQTMSFEGEKVPVYEKPFRLVQEVSLDRSLKTGDAVMITGTVKYQACDDKVCFIPASAPVSWTIIIGGSEPPCF
jgi:DsbC/DsbD-like thiol-disulfide interchange protein